MTRWTSLRASLGGLLAAVLVPLAAAGGAFLVHLWSQQRRDAVARLAEHARTLQRAVDRELALDQAVLRALAASPEIAAGDWRAFHEAASEASRVRPGSWFVLFDASGQTIVNTSVPYGTPLPNFRALLSRSREAPWAGGTLPLPNRFLFEPFETGQPSFSGLFFGPVNKRPVVASTVPVLVNGRARYVLALAYAAEFFAGLLRAEQSPHELTTGLFDGAGVFVARNRAPERFVGRRGPAPFAGGTSTLPREGTGESLSVEAVPFTYAFARSAVNDWVAAAGMPRSAVLAPAWRALWIWLAVLLAAGSTGAFLAFRLWRRIATPLGALAQQAQSLGERGREVPPTGIRELEALRSALHEAARNEQLRHDTEREREEARRSLRESEEKFRSVFEQAALGIGRVRVEDARWMDVNDALCRMLGYDREELLRTQWPAITHPDDVERDLESFRRLSAGELDGCSVEKRFVHRDGHLVWASLTLSVVRDAERRPQYEIAIIEDITSRKRTEDALRDANERLLDADRRKDEFLGMLSHELRNPLAPIRNSLYILDRVDPAGPQARRAKDVARRQTSHLTRLVDDLLDVTRIARGKIELRRQALDVSALARRTGEDYRALMHERELELVVAAPGDALVVDGDETRLAQVLGNLLSNAAKFTPSGGRVAVEVERDGGRAVVRVRDTGVGVSAELLPTIFDPFIQAKQTLARSEGGLGLGLALVKGLTELHGGRVSVTSTPGAGTAFTVELPLAQATASARRTEATRQGTRAYRVLVVDDNADAAESLAELVRMFGHEVHVAYDGPSAVASVAASLPDVVLCDLGLPGMDGYEVAKTLRAKLDGKIQLVAVSGYARPEDVKRSAEAGFDAHVAKPPDPARIERLLA